MSSLPFNDKDVVEFSPGQYKQYGAMAAALEGTTREEAKKIVELGTTYCNMALVKCMLQEHIKIQKDVRSLCLNYLRLMNSIEQEILEGYVRSKLAEVIRLHFENEIKGFELCKFYPFMLGFIRTRATEIQVMSGEQEKVDKEYRSQPQENKLTRKEFGRQYLSNWMQEQNKRREKTEK